MIEWFPARRKTKTITVTPDEYALIEPYTKESGSDSRDDIASYLKIGFDECGEAYDANLRRATGSLCVKRRRFLIQENERLLKVRALLLSAHKKLVSAGPCTVSFNVQDTP